MTFDTQRVFLFTEGTQLGPFDLATAESLWKQVGSPEEMWLWSPGMKDWAPIGDLLRSALPGDLPSQTARILAVDDDPVMLEMIRLTLENAGYPVVTANDMLPACRLLEKQGLSAFQGIVTDYQMPGGSGLDLVRWIKQRDESLQTLLLTARDDKQLVKAGLRAGIFDFLEKPLNQEHLIQSLKEAVELTNKRREERQALLEMVKIRLSGQGVLAEEVISKMAARESNSSSLLLKLDSIVKYSRKLEESSSSSGMKGELGDLLLLDIIQLLTQAGKNGKLAIFPHPGQLLVEPCEIYFKAGNFYHVRSGEHQGIHALQLLLQCQKGTFEFTHGVTTDVHSISGDPIALMLMISAEIDEARSNDGATY